MEIWAKLTNSYVEFRELPSIHIYNSKKRELVQKIMSLAKITDWDAWGWIKIELPDHCLKWLRILASADLRGVKIDLEEPISKIMEKLEERVILKRLSLRDASSHKSHRISE